MARCSWKRGYLAYFFAPFEIRLSLTISCRTGKIIFFVLTPTGVPSFMANMTPILRTFCRNVLDIVREWHFSKVLKTIGVKNEAKMWHPHGLLR